MAAITAAAEWLYGIDAVWAWVAAAACAVTAAIALLAPRRPVALAAGAAALALGLVLVVGMHAVRQIECCWPAVREARVTAASKTLQGTIAVAEAEARRLDSVAAAVATEPQPRLFDALERAMAEGPQDLERGVVVLGPNGAPLAWAGRHRMVPVADTAELHAVITPFYVTLDARRQTQTGATAIGTVLLDAAPAIADRGGALSVLFARAHGVELRFDAPEVAPRDTDEFDVCPRRCDSSYVMLAVRPRPPSQGDAKLATLSGVATRAGLALAALLVSLLFAAPPGRWRWFVAAGGTWAAARGLFGPAVLPPALFSPATFYRPLLGEFSDSAGSLLSLAALALLVAGALWRRGIARRWWSLPLAGLLLFYAPYFVRYLGRGIAPPATGVSFGLWLSWETALAVASMALVLFAAVLVRGPGEPPPRRWPIVAACAWAALAGLAGLLLWRPSGAWPEWYTFLWLPALVGVIVPAPRRWALPGIAIVAGTAAALVTWGATVEGRLALAERDAQHLGTEPDPLAVAALERLGAQVTEEPPARTAADLYALWRGSSLADENYPTTLAVWDPHGDEQAELRLAAVDLPTPLLAAFARSEPSVGPRVERLERVPGVHYVLTTPLAGDVTLTVGVGPRSRLLPESRVARFLRGEPALEPPYAVTLTIPVSEPEPTAVRWTRVGWTAHGHRGVTLPIGTALVHLTVELRGPWPLLVRAILVALFDVVLLFVAWAAGLVVAEGTWPRWPVPRGVLTSYRGRLTLVLAAFFIAPVLAFSIWSFTRLGDTTRASGDLMIHQTLRDAAASANAAPTGAERLAAMVADLGQTLDADLWSYQGGRLAGTSAPVLAELGLVDPLLAPAVYRRLALEDELEMSVNAQTAGRPTRIGYRVIGGEGAQQVVFAAPQLADDETLRRQQEDLALVLILATIAGFIAAVVLAGFAARTMARPVAVLRDAALAVGRGETPAPFPRDAPREFSPVLSAFDRMAHDVRASAAALEEARHRTAQVLGNVATAVVAVDARLVVTLANPRAAELLGAELEPGADLERATPPAWAPVWKAVREFLAAPPAGGGIADREFTIGGRDIRVQLAPLGTARAGCVVALDDSTALARAARILAWGEMARQVAHEIKNPLTPIRLGIQHLERVYAARGSDFDRTLRETAERITAEIDRLDAIARAFSRFGAPGGELAPLEAVDLLTVAREVVQLYALGGGAGSEARVVLAGTSGALARARKDEVKEVLVNLVENSRNAGAKEIAVRVEDGGLQLAVEDDGRGIPSEALARVFEPTFSTTSSGSGLGLAIARRLVESWGGSITLTSAPGEGTTVRLTLKQAPRAGAP